MHLNFNNTENLFMLKLCKAYFLAIGLCFALSNDSLSKNDPHQNDEASSSKMSFIQETYLKKFPIEALTSDQLQKNEAKKQKIQLQLAFWPIEIELKKITRQDQLKSFFTHVKPPKKNTANINTANITKQQTIDKLDILSAKTRNIDTECPGYTDGFADTIAKLSESSALGQVAFIHELTNPTTNVATLQEKQAFIKKFASGELQPLNRLLEESLIYEESIARLWAYGNEFIPDTMKPSIYWGNGIFSSRLLPSSVSSYLDKTPMALLPLIIDFPVSMLGWTAFGGGMGFGVAAFQAIRKGHGKYFLSAIIESIKNTGSGLRDSLLHPIETTKTTCAFIAKIPGYLQSGFNNLSLEYQFAIIYTTYMLGMVTYNVENHFAHLQKHFIGLASFLNEVRAIAAFFQKNNINFALAFPELEDLINLDNKAKHSKDFNQLVDLLKTSTFKGTSSKLSYLGRVKCAYKLLINARQEFEPILYAMAKLQMYNGIAKLMTSSANKQNSFCFAEFVDYGPYVEAVDFWNPMVGQETAVSNSLLMTPAEKDIILHGPNTGGKTTTIKGLMYNIILAQTFGIGAARKLILSPFAQINCFMDIQDDVSQGSSLFDAEVRFATELYNSIQTLENNEYAFTIADEILRSTSPRKGQACAYQFTKKLAKNSNSMSITVTHYPKLVELATENPNNGFRTFHVEIKRDINGKVIRTYKLKLGSTDENIAGDILQEHGIFNEADLLEVERLEEEFNN